MLMVNYNHDGDTLNSNPEVDCLSAILLKSTFAAMLKLLSAIDVRRQVVIRGEFEDFRSLTMSIYLMT